MNKEKKRTGLQESLEHIPHRPGVYLLLDKKGRLLYVGKAKVLSERVRSYFQKGGLPTPRLQALAGQIATVEVVVTESELEALILENNLIKKKHPRYNIILRDDKNYPYLRLPIQDPFPRLEVVRRVREDGALYFGPYVPANALRETLKVIHKTFPLATCEIDIDGHAPRACIEFEIHRCLAPCTGNQSRDAYRQVVEQVRLFLEGKNKELLRTLKNHMEAEAERLHFEEAARLRDRIAKIERVLERQRISFVDQRNQDVLALAREKRSVDLQVFLIRGGLLNGRRDFFWEDVGDLTDEEIVRSSLSQFYHKLQFIPEEIIIGVPLKESGLFEKWLAQRRGAPVRLVFPQKGKLKGLIRLVEENAALSLREQLRHRFRGEEAARDLQRQLDLKRVPRRIEAFDISNFMGREAVGSMVVWEGGSEKKKEYRHFRIKTVEGANDFAMLQEVLFRHYEKVRRQGEEMPDLIVIDGGKGQLHAALEVLDKLGLQKKDIIGLAKAKGEKGERVFVPGIGEAIPLAPDSNGTHLLQRIRDEAHRFAVTYHRRLRKQKGFHSALTEIEGIGPARQRLLLKQFGSLQRMGDASLEEIKEVPGITSKVAERVFRALKGED